MELELIPVTTEISNGDFLPIIETELDNISINEIYHTLWISQGSITKASIILNCSHSSLWNFIQNNSKLQEYQRKVIEYRNEVRTDVLEDIAFNKALLGDSTILWKLLSTYAPHRGYGDKQSLEIKHDVPPHLKVLLDSLKDLRQDDNKAKLKTETST